MAFYLDLAFLSMAFSLDTELVTELVYVPSSVPFFWIDSVPFSLCLYLWAVFLPFSLLAFLCVAYLSAFLSSLALQGTNIIIQSGFNYKLMKIFFAGLRPAPRAQMGV